MTGPVATVRAAFDGVLARGGFAFNQATTDRGLVEILYEALPADAARLVPDVAPALGDPDGRCIDLWIRYDTALGAVTDATMEWRPVTALLRELGHGDAAAAVEAADGLDAQVAAYAAGFARLFPAR